MRFFRDLSLTLLSTAVVLMLLEAGLRLAHVRYQASFYQPEQERVFALRPNAAGWNVSENEVYIRINSDGMRDHERPLARPSSTLRIAVLGSSESEGRQVPLEKNFATVINRRLDQRFGSSGHSADVMNFAVNGYTFSQYYLTLRDHVWKYDPQIVILVLNVPNVFKNTRKLNWGDPPPPFYVLQNGQLVPDESTRSAPPLNPRRLYWNNLFSDWMDRSTVLSLFNRGRNRASEEFHALARKLKKAVAKPANTALPPDLTRWTYLPDLPETQEAWAIGEAFLDLMRQQCFVHGTEFWIVTADQEMQSHPNLAQRARFVSEKHIPSLGASDQRIQRFADAHGIPVILLAQPMGDYAASHGVPLHGFPPTPYNTDPWPFNTGHWNELGHEVAGTVVAQELLHRSLALWRWGTTGGPANEPVPSGEARRKAKSPGLSAWNRRGRNGPDVQLSH